VLKMVQLAVLRLSNNSLERMVRTHE
jgi:hypothetical protein